MLFSGFRQPWEHAVILNRLIALTVLAAVLTSCATRESQPARSAVDPRQEGVKSSKKQQQLQWQLASGVYRCEFGQSLEIQRVSGNLNRIELRWQGNRHTLERQKSASGLPRYEDPQNGLLWIDLPWKSVLMDASSGRPLANECKVAQRTTTGS
jgi:hypothetical protein